MATAATLPHPQVKGVNPNVSTMAYFNQLLSWPQYAYTTVLTRHPAWQLKNATGHIIRLPGDPSFPQPADGMLVPDYTNASAAYLWWSSCANLTLTGLVDGCFADRADNNTVLGRNHLSVVKAAKWLSGKIAALQTLQWNVGGNGLVIANHAYYPNVSATMIESYAANESYILQHMAAVAAGKTVLVHAGYAQDGADQHCTNITNSLAAFLIGAGVNSYYACSKGW